MEDRNANLDSRGKPRVQTEFNDPSLTEQADAKKADINQILKRAGVTGIIEHLANVDEVFMDVSEFTDYATMRQHVAKAETAFMSLPSKVREAFNHSVDEWLDAAHATREELADRGILEAFGVAPAATPDSVGGSTDPATTEGTATSTEGGTAS